MQRFQLNNIPSRHQPSDFVEFMLKLQQESDLQIKNGNIQFSAGVREIKFTRENKEYVARITNVLGDVSVDIKEI